MTAQARVRDGVIAVCDIAGGGVKFLIELTEDWAAKGCEIRARRNRKFHNLPPGGQMDPWISHISNSVGADPAAVRLAIGHVFGFLLKRYPDGEADEVIDMIPGAREVVAEAATSVPPKRSFASRALGGMGGLIGGKKGETFELTSNLLALGFTNDQLKRLTHEIFGGAALIAGREKVQRLTDPIPGLSGFLWPEAKGKK